MYINMEFAQGKTLSRRFFDEYSFKQLRRETRGQWQKCYGKASMSNYYLVRSYTFLNDFFHTHMCIHSRIVLEVHVLFIAGPCV